MQYKEVITLTVEECLADFKTLKSIDIDKWDRIPAKLNKFKLCTRNSVGSGSCYGDSGGPLVGHNNTLLGIISGSIGCSDGYPDIYTNVFYQRKWINDEMDNLDNYVKGLTESGLESLIGSHFK